MHFFYTVLRIHKLFHNSRTNCPYKIGIRVLFCNRVHFVEVSTEPPGAVIHWCNAMGEI